MAVHLQIFSPTMGKIKMFICIARNVAFLSFGTPEDIWHPEPNFVVHCSQDWDCPRKIGTNGILTYAVH
jgi:hypothetical protein